MASKSERTSGLKATETTETPPAPPSAVRPRFRERQVLRAADLEAQQAYLIVARRRHNIGQHGWGIVYGLEIQVTPELVVQPGVAVDGYGRELIVTAPVKIPTSAFTELHGEESGEKALDVWLLYQLIDGDVPQRGTWSCGPGQNTRNREQATLRLTPAAQRLPPEAPRNPFEVPSSDVPFLPHRTPPDDPAMEWPVYLGTVRLVTAPNDPESPRPFATLTGAVVTAPSGLARVQIDAELQSDPKLFSLELSDASGKSVERLAIDRKGDTTINGNTTVTNPFIRTPGETSLLHLRVGHVGPVQPSEPAGMLSFREIVAPAAAAPWRLYRTSITENKQTVRQLRFEIAHPGDEGNPTTSRFVIGQRDNLGVFSSCFKLSADCTLTINGDVTVLGQLVESPIKPDVLDPRFGGLLAEVWAEGATVGEVIATIGTITGTVRQTDGTAMPDVIVQLKNGLLFDKIVQTDALGRFTEPLIPAGTYEISTEPPGFKRTVAHATIQLATTVDVTLTVEPLPPPPTGTITGTVQDAQGTAVPGVPVELTNTAAAFTRTDATNDAGQFLVPQIPVGEYRIRVVPAGFVSQVHTLSAGQTLNVILRPENPIP